MNIVRAVWFGAGSALLSWVQDEQRVGRITLKRVGGGCYALIPWTKELDNLEAEVKAWGHSAIRRCWPEERIAMRDLVAELRADAGLLVDGMSADVDQAEIRMAEAKLRLGQVPELEDCALEYKSARIKAYRAQDWLRVRDTDEWGPVRSLEELRQLYYSNKLDDDTRKIRARAVPAP